MKNKHGKSAVFSRRSLAASALAAAAISLAGCVGGVGWASYGPGPLKPGDPESAVLARMGEPTERAKLGSGQRLVYARGPAGRHTWFVELTADGRIRSIVQTLSAGRFEQIKPGMSTDEVLQWLGPTTDRRQLAIDNRSLWGWRYENYDCLWFVTTLDRSGRVLDAGNAPDPLCDFKDPR